MPEQEESFAGLPDRLLHNRSLVGHMVRGGIGIAAVALALWGQTVVGWPALLLFGVAVWAWRGCPLCWTAGLHSRLTRARDNSDH
jgi:hypothetical protein